MQLIDEILEYLQYHLMSSRQDVERHLSSKVSSATVKRQIARGIEDEPPCVECTAARLRTLSAHVPLG